MQRKVHYVLSTHWDREWYQTFQDYRYRLVQLLDRVLEGWQREDLRGPFQTDGQAIILEDYLEVRPERESQIRAMVKSGRFMVGPWYVLPDEFLVSGEALIRNLQMGRSAARKWGGQPSGAGFLCDMFGHNSQMPQILAGFGIRAGFLWRGVNLVDQHLFRWEGADGTILPAYRFGQIGYCSYAAQVRRANPKDPRPSPVEIENNLRDFLEEENTKTLAGPLLLFDGGDHMEWDPGAYAVLARHFDRPEEPYQVVHSNLEAYLDEMVACQEEIPVTIQGELREPSRYEGSIDDQWLIAGVSSSRVWIKQANAWCQNLLCQWAEPLSAFAASTLGLAYPQGYLDTAWKWLIQNHPHDSICGCSIDAVHADMVYRFHQCEGIADRLTIEAGRHIAASVTGTLEEHNLRVVVFNPLPQPFDGIANLDLELPVDWQSFGETMGQFERKPSFRMYDASGQEIAYQRIGQALNQPRFRTFDWTFPQSYRVNVVSASLPLRIPAGGYTTLTLRPGQPNEPVRHSANTGLATSERSMENAYLAVTFEPNGWLTVTDKRSGQVYQRLLTFEDRADIGDGWNYGPAVNDQAFLSSTARSSLALVTDGPYQTTFRLRTVLDLPEQFNFPTMTRSETLRGLAIDSRVTLRAGADWLEVDMTVHNDVQDHRLRMLFPSGAQGAETCLMDTPFDVVERRIALRDDNYLYREQEVETRPQQTFTAVSNGVRGLAVISTGLMESAVQDLPERPIALTLLRATRKTVFTDGEPGGQVQGALHFRCWIAPFTGEPDRARLLSLGQALSGGLRAAQVRAADVERFRVEREVPAEAGFIKVEGPVVLTSLRQGPSGLEARLFNPNTFPADAILVCSAMPEGSTQPTTAQSVDFEGNPAGEVAPVVQGRVVIPFGPKQIRTIRL